MTKIQKIIYSILWVVIVTLLVTTCVYKKKLDKAQTNVNFLEAYTDTLKVTIKNNEVEYSKQLFQGTQIINPMIQVH